MKKLITTIAFIALSTVSAKAVEMPAFAENLSLTAGLAANQSVFGASARETNDDHSGNTVSDKKESGVFTDGYQSQFIELGIGQWVSLGYEHTPDSISTPTNTTRHGTSNEANVSVDFNDVNTMYVKLNLPYVTGLYVKAGIVETDLDIKEVMGSGSTYKNVSTEGSMMALGYQRYIKDTSFGIRFEGSYMELDPVSTDNGIAKGTVTTLNAQGHNKVAASNMEGLTGKIAVTYTFGRN
jgi:hypothetical protein